MWSEADKYYVETHTEDTVASLASALNKSVSTVTRYLRKKNMKVVLKESSKAIVQTEAKPVGDTHFQQLLGRRTGVGKKNKVVIMTEAAAELADDLKKNSNNTNKYARNVNKCK